MSKITKEQIAKWKKQYFAIFELTGEDGEVMVVSYPNWHSQKETGNSDIESFVEKYLNLNYLGGDKTMMNDISYHQDLKRQIDKILHFADVTKELIDGVYHITITDTRGFDGNKKLVFTCNPLDKNTLIKAERKSVPGNVFSKREKVFNILATDEAKKLLREELSDKNPYYYIPLLGEMEDLIADKTATIKKL